MRLRTLAIGLGFVGLSATHCTSPPIKVPTLPDGKEVIYGFLSQGTVSIADEALNNVWDLGPREPKVTLQTITWNENPADKYWRFIFYSLRPLSNLLFAFYTTTNTAYLDKMLDVIRSYVAFDAARPVTPPNPYLDDPHTACFREMMLVNIYGKLSRTSNLPADLVAPMKASIERLGTFLAQPQNFQEGENHGFNEAAALLVAAANFPEMPDAASWQALALSRLNGLMGNTNDAKELAVDADGVEVENSPFYHFYVLSAVDQDSEWMLKYNVTPPPGFESRLTNMFEYAAYSPMPSGYVPLLGASVTLDVHNLLPSVYSYTDDEDGDVITGFMTSTPHFTYIRTQGAQGEVPPFLNKRFPVSGQSFMRTSFNQASPGQSTWLSFNAGKWRNAHCHLDALAITYYSDGLALMPDGGLYEYANTATSARAAVVADYFNGTSAHNTVVVDGASQSNEPQFVDNVTEGLVVSGDGWGYQSASHQLYAGVTHSRSVVLLGQDAAIVFDHLTGSDAHDYTQTWHLWTDAAIATTGLDVAATGSNGNGGTAALALHQGITDGVKLTSVKGQNEPVVQGFYSDNYEHIYANYALEYTQHASQANFATLITSGDRAAVTPVLKTDFDTDGNISATVCAGDIDVEIVIEDQVRPGENVKVTSFKGCP